MQIFYIHGFGSSPQSETLKMLQETYPSAIGLTYDYTNPKSSILDMATQISSCTEDVTVFGSSLGGWYTEQLTSYVIADFVMYNPAITPETTLQAFEVPMDIRAKYRNLTDTRVINLASRNIVLCTDDEVIDPAVTLIKYSKIANIELTTGGHRMTSGNMKKICDIIQFKENQLC